MTSSIQVTVKEREPMTVVFLGMKGPYTQISVAFGKLYGWIGEKGYQPSGPPLGIYFNAPGQVPDDELSWELCSPIAGNVAPSGPDEQGLGVKRLEAVPVASTMHKGSYQDVGKTYQELSAWINENGYDAVGPAEEMYLTNPAEAPPDELLTEVRFPVRKR